MGEFFDLTFYSPQSPSVEKTFSEVFHLYQWRNEVRESKFSLLVGKTVYCETYCDGDLCCNCISISDVFFTKKNFQALLQQLLEVVAACFKQAPSVVLATGAYALAKPFLEPETCLSEVTQDDLHRFPFVFLRENHNFDFPYTTYQNGVFCGLNSGEDVQDIYTNPIRALMVDEGLTFEEARARLSAGDAKE